MGTQQTQPAAKPIQGQASVAPVNGQDDTPSQTDESKSPEQKQSAQNPNPSAKPAPPPNGGTQSTFSAMTEAQIDAIPDPVLREQVRAINKANAVLAAKVKDLNPTYMELCAYGKGKAGIQVSENGAIQFTGTRKAYGGFYLFGDELITVILGNHTQIMEWYNQNQNKLATKEQSQARAAVKKEEKLRKELAAIEAAKETPQTQQA